MAAKKYSVGGVSYDRPFKIRRLNHFGISVTDTGTAVGFYRDVLGFVVADMLDLQKYDPGVWLDGLSDTKIYFLRHNSDHHTLVLMPRSWVDKNDNPARDDITVNQITWQAGSLREVVQARLWLEEQGSTIERYGRDPGSNWHTYFPDPTGHTNELEYGIEQVGWDGVSKPEVMWPWANEHPALPTKSEASELEEAEEKGIDLTSGHRWIDTLPKTYDVGGVLLARPFKPVRIGPVSIFVADLDAAEHFYTETLGLVKSEESTVEGHRVLFLRANTEHHSIALFPLEVRSALGLSDNTTLLSFGVQLGSYEQLRDAKTFLEERGVKLIDLPQEIHPGIDYAIHAVAPDGHVMQLYYYMEQVGWDGTVRSPESRRRVEPGVWPETLEPMSDTYGGETFWGPLG
ncbi:MULTISPECIES: VOC family protein [Rhodococcus]|jgi:catechol 2,3-dioxygenase-like lactoylglutathione lyase family enzyme|uniref:VOC family protein n=1 Tax=Rhodococcus jostii TaxID=132919 RepID=A0ABU4CR84_RHOJO|nr:MULTISPECIES: VOC family protein [Rhodococcus]NHU42246.1 extradiol dioxygenase [Rhodococcus sp. A14]MDI9948915.1 VOC family protein [Rhodococcus sp. IEGM 1305]MDI9978176.1 VOC family protein [Rhodococcus sp. IEGM 1307]MDV6286066.1 VOC family protein [Rhodococcus jostii]PBC51662.1 extradiol dioxygenase [Rhodococcus sp. ACPA1]